MIVVCPCGQKNRLKNLAAIDKMVCGKCRGTLASEANRQAARNANAMLEIAAVLADKVNGGVHTHEEELIAQIIARHEMESRK